MATTREPLLDEQRAMRNPSVRLLFVEDNPADAELALIQLQKGGFEVTADVVQTADDFRSKLLSLEYDLVLSDLGLPNWSGLDALEILKEACIDIPFIMVTGTVGEETVAECLRLGATDYVLKDRPTRLPNAVRRALAEKALREERKRAEGALRASETRYRRLFEAAQDGILILDIDSAEIRDVNPFLTDLLGFTKAELLGKKLWEIGPFHDVLSSQDSFKELRNKGFIRYDNLPLKTRSGKHIAVEFVSNVYVAGDQKVIQCNIRDITERIQAEELLRESEERFRTTFENAGIGMALVDMEGRIIKSNPALRQMLGYSDEEFSRMVFTEYTHPDDQALDWRLFTELTTGKREKYEMEKRFLKKGGDVVWGDLTVSLVKDRNGRPVCSVGMVQEITKRKQAEEELRGNEQRLRLAVTASQAGIWEMDLINDQSIRSPRHDEIYGYAALQPVWNHAIFIAHVVTEDRESVTKNFDEAFTTGELVFECRIRKADDRSLRWISVLGRLIRNEKNEAIRMVGVVTDITERKDAEEHLAQMGARYRGLLEAAPDAMVVVNQAGDIVLLNVQTENQFGYSRDELLGKEVKSIIPKGFAERLVADGLRSVEDALAQQIGTGIELMGRRKNGSDFPIEIMLSPLENAEGILVTAAIRDISVRKRAEAEHIRLMTAIEQAAEGVVITDAEGEIQYVNPAFSTMTGYSREEALGKNPRFLKSGKQDAAFYASMWATLLAGQVWRGEMINRRKDGSLYTENMSITPVRNEQGEMTHIVAMKVDVTAQKLMEDQFRQAQRMEAVGRLAAGVAHDFNNLLTIIIGYNDLMLDQFVAGDPLETYLTEIKEAGQRAVGLTRQLLAFSRQQVLAPQVLDLNTLIANTAKMLKRLIGEDIDLVFSAGPSPAMVRADPGQIEQVMMNLAVNSRDAMPRGGKLTIESSHLQADEACSTIHFSMPVGAYVMLAVSDTGCGMSKDIQAHIFEPFFTTKEMGKGTGLGLATVYGIVKQTGGYIWVYSEPGAGTTFKIYLPAVKDAVQAAQESAVPAGGSETVLLVEDDVGLRGLARMVLAVRGGYKVLESIGGKEALVFAEQYKGTIHLLLTDVVMPGKGGRELSRELAALRPEMKILYMSGYTDDTVLRHGVLEEGMPFLQKPFTAESLLRKVRDVLDAAQPVS